MSQHLVLFSHHAFGHWLTETPPSRMSCMAVIFSTSTVRSWHVYSAFDILYIYMLWILAPTVFSAQLFISQSLSPIFRNRVGVCSVLTYWDYFMNISFILNISCHFRHFNKDRSYEPCVESFVVTVSELTVCLWQLADYEAWSGFVTPIVIAVTCYMILLLYKC